MLVLQEHEFETLVHFVRENFGINLDQKRILVEGRLGLHLTEAGYSSYQEYLNRVFADPTGAEVSNLVTRLTTNHTFFMREENHFRFLRQVVLPALAASPRDKDIRIWSAGCSSGEEPFTIAMTLHDHFGFAKEQWDTRILATDISSRALDMARKARYPATAMDQVPPSWLIRYFRRTSETEYEVIEGLREEVIFRSLNLVQGVFPFRKRFHVIFCRNVMIYFDRKTRNELIRKLYQVTEPGGYLFIGHAETLDRDECGYKYVQPAIYRRPS